MSILAPEIASAMTTGGVSPASDAVLQEWLKARSHARSPISRATIAQRFAELAETWRLERGVSSSVRELVLNQAYQRIIALGPRVIPHILLEMQSRPDHWFWALSALAGVNPIPARDRGDVHAMTSAWLAWGETEGFLD
jgi:hypothetical protein